MWALVPPPLLLRRLSLRPCLLLLHLLPLNDHHPRHHLHQVLASRLRPKQGHHCHCFAFVAAVLYATEAFCIISSLEAWSGSSQPSQACSGGQRTMVTGSSSPSSAAPTSISISQPYVRGGVFKSLGFFTSSCFDSPEIGWGWNLSQIPLRCPLGSQCEAEHQVGPRIQILCFRTLAHWESVTFRIFFFNLKGRCTINSLLLGKRRPDA